MDALRRLQQDFQAHVLESQPGPRSARIARRVAGTTRFDVPSRLAVYALGYRARLTEALGAEFPALSAVLGEAAFERVCRAFIDSHPSRDPNLRWYGAELAGFLAQSTPWRRRPVLAELAAFEWKIGLAFDAPDTAPLGFEALAAVPAQAWPTLRFVPHPSLHRLVLRWNAPDVSKALAQEAALPALRRSRRPWAWAIWRYEFTPRFCRLDDDEAFVLDALLLRGQPFGAVCAGLARRIGRDRAALRAAALLKGWIGQQMLTGIATEPAR